MSNKQILSIVVLSVIILFSGCATTGQVNTLTDNTKLFMSKVDDWQVVANKALALAERDGAINAKTAAYVVSLSNDVNAFKPQLSEIVRAVDEAPDNVFSKGRAGLIAARGLIPAPYGEIALLGLGILELLTLKRKREAEVALTKEEGKRRSEKAGTKKTIKELATMPVESITANMVETKLFTNIGDERARNGLT